MAKKTSTERDAGKTRFELRFDEDVYAGVKKLADDSNISVNQLMQGIARWAVGCGHPGEAMISNEGHDIAERAQPGCVWFGDQEDVDVDGQGRAHRIPAMIYFMLDFTERHVIRDDWQARPKNTTRKKTTRKTKGKKAR